GLFARERKRALPPSPRRLGVVTSPVGAVWGDIQNVVARRDARVELVLAAAQVQGVGAVESLIAALDGLAQVRDLDAVIIARGGSSTAGRPRCVSRYAASGSAKPAGRSIARSPGPFLRDALAPLPHSGAWPRSLRSRSSAAATRSSKEPTGTFACRRPRSAA